MDLGAQKRGLIFECEEWWLEGNIEGIAADEVFKKKRELLLA